MMLVCRSLLFAPIQPSASWLLIHNPVRPLVLGRHGQNMYPQVGHSLQNDNLIKTTAKELLSLYAGPATISSRIPTTCGPLPVESTGMPATAVRQRTQRRATQLDLQRGAFRWMCQLLVYNTDLPHLGRTRPCRGACPLIPILPFPCMETVTTRCCRMKLSKRLPRCPNLSFAPPPLMEGLCLHQCRWYSTDSSRPSSAKICPSANAPITRYIRGVLAKQSVSTCLLTGRASLRPVGAYGPGPAQCPAAPAVREGRQQQMSAAHVLAEGLHDLTGDVDGGHKAAGQVDGVGGARIQLQDHPPRRGIGKLQLRVKNGVLHPPTAISTCM